MNVVYLLYVGNEAFDDEELLGVYDNIDAINKDIPNLYPWMTEMTERFSDTDHKITHVTKTVRPRTEYLRIAETKVNKRL